MGYLSFLKFFSSEKFSFLSKGVEVIFQLTDILPFTIDPVVFSISPIYTEIRLLILLLRRFQQVYDGSYTDYAVLA